MGGHMNIRKKDIAKRVAEKEECTQVIAFRIINSFMDELTEILASGDKAELRGFGVFETTVRKGGMRQNPKTLERISVPEKRVVRFRMGKEMKEKLEGEDGQLSQEREIDQDHQGR